MSNYAISLKRTASLATAIALVAALTLVSFSSIFSAQAGAAQLQSRSLTLNSTLAGNVGTTETADSELNGADTTHTFQFDVATDATIQSVRFEYCTTAISTCTAPTGLNVDDTSGTTITAQTQNGGAFADPFALDATSSTSVLNLDTAAGGNSLTAGDTLVFSFNDITNPTVLGTFFVRITLYTANNWTSPQDTGTVANSITTGIAITSRVKETLGFSTTADNAAGIVDPTASCVPVTGTGAMTLGDQTEQTLDITQAYDNYSAFRIYSNASQGVVVTYEGETLTKSVTEDITEIGGTAAASTVGAEQFGLAADLTNGTNNSVAYASSSTPADLTYVDVSADLDTGTGGEIDVAAQYESGAGTITNGGSALFAFVAGAPTTIASSSTFVDCKTVAVRYIANIAPLTEAGTYTTTVVYQAVPTY